MDILSLSIRKLKGIGDKKAALLKNLNIETLGEAIQHFPRDYENWQSSKPLTNAVQGQTESFIVRFKGDAEVKRIASKTTIVKWTISDDTGKACCIWFNQSFRTALYKANRLYFVRGKVEYKYGELQIHNPIVEEYLPEKHDSSKILPIYSLTQGLSQNDLRNLLLEALRTAKSHLTDEFDMELINRYNLVKKDIALTQIHFPSSPKQLEQARNRLVFEELFMLRLALCLIRVISKEKYKGIIFNMKIEQIEDFIKNLPYELTHAQLKAINEILGDFNSGIVMNRLLQGDVGSGKTVIAGAAIYCAYLNGYQSAIMVPTEILAKQHYDSFKALFSSYGIKIGYLTGSMSQSAGNDIKDKLFRGELDLLIGTHALIQDGVSFRRLALVITDEQHRFGVGQRALLQEKGLNPHVLVMSATPIPRTISLLFYGDLDISIVDQMPPGRKPVMCYHVSQSMRSRVFEFVQKQVNEGRQAYIVCPLIEDSDSIDSQSATEMFKQLKEGQLRNISIGLLHGKMTSAEKEIVMQKFLSKEFDVLVCTTVIEVGVNVPNASVIVVESAERFGLAQLHQLRGRVGRGEHQSYCVLIADTKTQASLERMEAMVKFSDGFAIADMDLKLRGPGDFLGTRQHGLPEFKIASLVKDMDIIRQVQTAVEWVLDNPEKHIPLIEYVTHQFDKKLEKLTLN
jgi:ATP-dependent DNA helicase RecG